MDIVEKARVFATAAHASVKQLRKYTNEPYIVHPAQVATIVGGVPHTAPMLAAAWMHDVLEDTGVTEQDMRAEFGDYITDLVMWLTDVSKPEDGNRATRRSIDLEHTKLAPREAKTIKLADIISNTSSIKEHDEAFAKVYLVEKAAQIAVLTEGDPELLEIAKWHVGIT